MTFQQQIKELQKQNQLLKQLGTTIGFYEYYVENIPSYRTYIECFNAVNDLYFDLFGEYRYSCWHSFKQSKFYKNNR